MFKRSPKWFILAIIKTGFISVTLLWLRRNFGISLNLWNGINLDLVAIILKSGGSNDPTLLALCSYHWNGNVVILMNFLSVATPKVVIMTTFGAATDKNFVKMTFPFQWIFLIWHWPFERQEGVVFPILLWYNLNQLYILYVYFRYQRMR